MKTLPTLDEIKAAYEKTNIKPECQVYIRYAGTDDDGNDVFCGCPLVVCYLARRSSKPINKGHVRTVADWEYWLLREFAELDFSARWRVKGFMDGVDRHALSYTGEGRYVPKAYREPYDEGAVFGGEVRQALGLV